MTDQHNTRWSDQDKPGWRTEIGQREVHWLEAAKLICLSCKKHGLPEIHGGVGSVSYIHPETHKHCDASSIHDELVMGDL